MTDFDCFTDNADSVFMRWAIGLAVSRVLGMLVYGLHHNLSCVTFVGSACMFISTSLCRIGSEDPPGDPGLAAHR